MLQNSMSLGPFSLYSCLHFNRNVGFPMLGQTPGQSNPVGTSTLQKNPHLRVQVCRCSRSDWTSGSETASPGFRAQSPAQMGTCTLLIVVPKHESESVDLGSDTHCHGWIFFIPNVSSPMIQRHVRGRKGGLVDMTPH